jgi:hypothetical protein
MLVPGEVGTVRCQRMKVVSREPHIYLIDVALRPFQKKDEGRFYLPFVPITQYN